MDAFAEDFFKLGLPLFFFVTVGGSALIMDSKLSGSTTCGDLENDNFFW